MTIRPGPTMASRVLSLLDSRGVPPCRPGRWCRERRGCRRRAAGSSTAPVSKTSFVIAGTSPRRAAGARSLREVVVRRRSQRTERGRIAGAAPRSAREVEHDRSLQVEDVRNGAARLGSVMDFPQVVPDQPGQERSAARISWLQEARGGRPPSRRRDRRNPRERRIRPCAAKRLPLTSGHRRKPGTRGFTSYEFEPHLAHLLVCSGRVRTIFYPTRDGCGQPAAGYLPNPTLSWPHAPSLDAFGFSSTRATPWPDPTQTPRTP